MRGPSAHTEAIIASLYEGTMDELAWRRGLSGIAQLVGGQGPLLLSIAPDTGEILRDEIGDYDPHVFMEFRQTWARKDIRVPAGIATALYEPVTEAMILPSGQWERSEIFNEFLFEHDLAWFLAAWVHKSATKLTCLSVQATHDRGPFAPRDVTLLRPLIPHLRRALDIKDRLQRHQLRADTLRLAMEHSSFGFAVLGSRGDILDASSAAIAALEDARVLRHEFGGVFTLTGSVERALRQRISSPSVNCGAWGDLLRLPRRNGGPPLCLVLSPVPAVAQLWMADSPRWLLFVFDSARPRDTSVRLLMLDLGLTQREAELVASLAAGETLSAAASRLKVKLATARAHLRSVYRKTGINSQSALVRRVLSGPASHNFE